MADEPTEQSAPTESAPAPETPAEPTPEPAATDQTTTTPVEPTSPSAESPPEVQTPEIAEAVVSEPTPVEPSTQPAAAAPAQPSSSTSAQQTARAILQPNDLAHRGLAARRNRKESKLQKILELVKKEGPIGSLDVQKYLHVSDSSATRYLKELVKRGALKRTGSPSHARYSVE